MEKAVITAFVNTVMPPLFKVLSGSCKMVMNVIDDSDSMRRKLVLLAASMDDDLRRTKNPTAAAKVFGDQLRELTHDMEDCIERFLHRVSCAEGASRARRLGRFLLTICTRYRFGDKIKALNRRLEELTNERLCQFVYDKPPPPPPLAPAAAQQREHVQLNPVGVEGAKGDILAMLEESPEELRVIAIVGFGGSGKTTLAKAVFRSTDDDRIRVFRSCRAWVDRAKEKNAGEIFRSLLQQFGYRGQGLLVDDEQYLQAQLMDYLRGRSRNNGSRIIVTTTIKSEANTCCGNGKGFIYQMQNLEDQYCKTIALGEAPSPELQMGSEELLKKCDGHPLSLVCVANYLGGLNEPTGQRCRELCRYLGSKIHDNGNFERLKGVIMDNYTSLSNHVVRACLLYLSIFPNDVPLEKKVIIRRWIAEGFARSEDVDIDDQTIARWNFETFVDWDIFHPIIDTSNNGDVKMCKTRSIVHEYMLYKASRLERFIMSFPDWRRKVRHLCIDHRTPHKRRTTTDMDLSCVRSLTIFGTAGDTICEFHRIQYHGYSKSTLKKLSENSKLETLSGFIADFKSQGFLEILGHMSNLKKSSAAGDHDSILARKLSEAIQEYINPPLYIGDNRKLSICLQTFSGSLLNSLDTPCELTSLKLHGELRSLPRFVKWHTGLVELCLSSITVTRDVLSDLYNLKCLLYLKLISDCLDEFVIPQGAFRSLRRLCFKVQVSVFPRIEAGALRDLVSLQLLCRHLVGLAGIEIEDLRELKEVTLDSEVSRYTKESWETRARQHPNRPRILYTYKAA
uniref:NB-ARC domain-containing protein n=1 Tax=Oryza rufipogon TaxID=4529 RepID=A0A0E0QIL9_ORYRU